MKKIISAIAALAACAVMLTACGGDTGTADLQDEVTTTSAAVTEGNDDTDSVPESDEADEKDEKDEDGISSDDEEITNEEDTSEDDDNSGDSAPVSSVYASLDEFAMSDIGSLPYKKVAATDTNTYDFVKTLEGANGLYLNVESTDNTFAMSMAFDAKNNIALDMIDESGVRVLIIITNFKMYMLDPSSMTGMYFAVDESIFDDYNMEEMLSQINIDENAISDSEEIDSCNVEIAGEEYTFEYSGGSGFLYKADGKLYAIVTDNDSLDLTALIVNEFSGNVPANAFDIPSGYELVDLSDAMAGLE